MTDFTERPNGHRDTIAVHCGMSAVCAAILSLCRRGQHLVITDDAYKQTLNFVTNVLPRFGISATVVPMDDYQAMADAVTADTVMIISESPTNPYLNVADVDEVVRIARRHKILSVIDSTFATPYNSNPLSQGADIVIHSTTKYLAGHNDVLGGAVVTFEINGDLDRTLRFLDGLKMCLLGPSLGGPETLVTHPALNSYYNVSRQERYRPGIIDELVRLSVGLEDPRDIIADLERGFSNIA
jgi:cystathionine beta-lyase/cystathionine gamma-synthase